MSSRLELVAQEFFSRHPFNKTDFKFYPLFLLLWEDMHLR